MLTRAPANLSRWRLAKSQVAGILHYCVPTLVLGAIFQLRARRRAGGPSVIRSIVVFRLDHIGDLVLTSPMLRELRSLFPAAHVTLVVSAATRALVDHCPYVDRVVSLEGRPGLMAARSFCREHLAGRTWDLAIVPRWDVDVHFATLMSCYTGAPRRIAFSEKASPVKRCLNWGFDRLYTRVLPPGPLKHEAERNLDIVRDLGARIGSAHLNGRSPLEVWLTPSDRAEAARLWNELGVADCQAVIAYGIGAGDERRQWPARNFAALIQRLSPAARAVLVCGPNERHLADAVQRHSSAPLPVLQGASLRQVAAFLSQCTLFVGNDSGPLHLAVAAGISVLEISCHPADGDPGGENSPDRFGPFTTQCRVMRPERAKPPCQGSCASDQPHCIAQISATQVGQAVTSLLDERLIQASYAGAGPSQRASEDVA
jgi:ADP-heptose:LPS heptosyltransferase